MIAVFYSNFIVSSRNPDNSNRICLPHQDFVLCTCITFKFAAAIADIILAPFHTSSDAKNRTSRIPTQLPRQYYQCTMFILFCSKVASVLSINSYPTQHHSVHKKTLPLEFPPASLFTEGWKTVIELIELRFSCVRCIRALLFISEEKISICLGYLILPTTA